MFHLLNCFAVVDKGTLLKQLISRRALHTLCFLPHLFTDFLKGTLEIEKGKNRLQSSPKTNLCSVSSKEAYIVPDLFVGAFSLTLGLGWESEAEKGWESG